MSPSSLASGSPASWFDRDNLETVGVPDELTAKGVTRVRWAMVIMYRPWCMFSMSSHAISDRAANKTAWAKATLYELEDLAATQRELRRRQVPVLTLSYAELLWQPAWVETRVAEFAPCAGALNLSLVPTLGLDVFEENNLKLDSSLTDYGKSVSPHNYGLTPWDESPSGAKNTALFSIGQSALQQQSELPVVTESGRCFAPAEELYDGLDQQEMARAARVEKHLWQLSKRPVAESPAGEDTTPHQPPADQHMGGTVPPPG